MRDATGRGLGRPRRLFVVFLSLGHPRAWWSCPVETGEILAGGGEKCEGHALVAVGLEKISIWSCSPSCMTCCLLSDGIYICGISHHFSPSHGFGFPSRSRGGSGEIQHRGCVSCHGDARPGRRRWGPGGFSKRRPSQHVHKCSLVPDPG